jgi:hypothetical protein
MSHIISLLFSNWIWKILSEISVYVNVTHNITVILKVNMKNMQWDNCLSSCVTHNITVILNVNMTNLEWVNCLCNSYTWYHCYSQSKCEKFWVRLMFMWMLHIIWLLFSNWIWKILSEIIVYVNVTHDMTIILKVCEIYFCVNVTSHMTAILKVSMKNLE